MTLEIKNLAVTIENKEILKDLSLEIQPGKVYALMGPNGSGKSTLSNSIMGHPKYKITNGKILLNKKDITDLKVNEKAKLGLFLAFQYPSEVSGVTITQFLKQAHSNINKKELSYLELNVFLKEKMKQLKIDQTFVSRSLNEGFSGGEKKKNEILQMLILKPKIAILDEPDSGVDIDALKLIANGIKKTIKENNTGILLITHYNRILNYIKPDFVYILKNGRIIKSGNHELAKEIEREGYEK